MPHILQAVRYVPVGRQEGLRHRLPLLPGLGIEAAEDPVLGIVRYRGWAKANGNVTLAADLRVVTSSLVFGILSRADEVRHRQGRRWAIGERVGPWSCFPIAASVTAGARLLLAILDRMVADHGGVVAYRDTDSSLIPAAPEREVLVLADGSKAWALSWAEVNEILAAFPPLSPAPSWPVWSVERGTVDDPLRGIVFGPKRHAEFTGDQEDLNIVDSTEAQLGGRFADPPTMRGRAPNGQRRWSVAAVEREVAFILAREDDPEALRPDAPWDVGEPFRFPALRRLMVKSPEMARALPACFEPRPGTRYLEGEVDDTRRGVCPTPVALDPGGDLANWQQFGWVDKAIGTPLRLSTDPMDHDAVLLATLDAKGAGWTRPPRGLPIHEVVIDPKRLRRVGRVSGVIDADTDGLPGDLVTRRPVYEEVDGPGVVQRDARRLGARAFSRLTGLPLRVAERAAASQPISAHNLAKALVALGHLDLSRVPRCAAQGCEEPVTRQGALYHTPRCREREKKRRKRAPLGDGRK